MSQLSLQGASVSFGAEDILKGITCQVNSGDRIGLVGRNGSGKSTLLHLLAGLLALSGGMRQLARSTSCFLVEQISSTGGEARDVRSELLSMVTEAPALMQQLEETALALAAGDEEASAHYSRLLERMEDLDAFAYESRIVHVASGLGFTESDFERPLATLSGGERARLSMAKALLAEPDILLMDEPTNHLDLRGLQWLEGFLSHWRGVLVVASHDRYFLDKVANQVWYLEDGRLESFKGNYSKFEELLAAKVTRQRREYDAQQEFIAKEEEFIRRYRAGQRSREARGRATKLARVTRLTAPSRSRVAKLELGGERSSELVLTAKSLAVGYGAEAIVQVGDFEVEAGARIALVGPNGSGKTTLLKSIASELTPVSGAIQRGPGVRIAHYWQEAENLGESATVLESMLSVGTLTPQQARDLLGRFLFSGDDVAKRISMLSGGERSRVALARLVTAKANLLLLDEPTNHLDIPSREALEEALMSYKGTLLFASHDRRLISRMATALWVIDARMMTQFVGTLDEFNDKAADAQQRETPLARKEPRPSANQERQRQEQVQQLEARIAEHEARLSQLEMAIGESSERADVSALVDLGSQYKDVQGALASLIEGWTTLMQG